MNVLIVGAGSMGQWLAERLSTAHTVTVTDTDADSTAAVAADLGVEVDAGGDYDLIAFAVPMSAIESAAREHAGRADAVIDVTGEMRDTLAALRDSFPDAARVSTHPLFAPDNEPGTIAVVEDSPSDLTTAALDALVAVGNDLYETTATEHDEAMETVQAKTHAAILAFALAAEDVPEPFHTPVSGPLTELADTVTTGNPSVYGEIQRRFDGADEVAAAAERVATDPDSLADLFEEVAE
ncbi:MAG: prephenate dehydrogenase/arogenate dehydrogenase family protein [Halobacteriales archaeon]|nr:prephenate dehydrogenase/arogenate dehydrogenase family protein [Halobacteriales archaeon]